MDRRLIKTTWIALKENRDHQVKEKGKIVRCMTAIKKYILYHSWRRYARNVRYENMLQNRDKIEGAYILIKRFKNRLKGFDGAIKKVSDEKADREDFVKLKQSLVKARIESVFDDMKILFDSTVKQFDQKVVHERKEVAKAYERIVEKQRSMILGFEMKYNTMIKGRMDKLEAVTDDLAFE